MLNYFVIYKRFLQTNESKILHKGQYSAWPATWFLLWKEDEEEAKLVPLSLRQGFVLRLHDYEEIRRYWLGTFKYRTLWQFMSIVFLAVFHANARIALSANMHNNSYSNYVGGSNTKN